MRGLYVMHRLRCTTGTLQPFVSISRIRVGLMLRLDGECTVTKGSLPLMHLDGHENHSMSTSPSQDSHLYI